MPRCALSHSDTNTFKEVMRTGDTMLGHLIAALSISKRSYRTT